jgi:hypothetical protein
MTGSVALSYVNFPVKVVIKSSKLIPTMMLGILILRRTYSALEYIAAVMLCAGVASFTLIDSKVRVCPRMGVHALKGRGARREYGIEFLSRARTTRTHAHTHTRSVCLPPLPSSP